MKLMKAASSEVSDFNEMELLQMENEFLRDELEFQDTLHSLELMETVLNCIEQEGEVSKSIEVMFGEGQDMSTFKDELQKAYGESTEALVKLFDGQGRTGSAGVRYKALLLNKKLGKLARDVEDGVVIFPVKFKSIQNSARNRSLLSAYTRCIDALKNDNLKKEDIPSVLNDVKSALLGKSEDAEFVECTLSSKSDLRKWIQEMGGYNRLIIKCDNDTENIIERFSDGLDQTKKLVVARVYFFLMRTAITLSGRVIRNFEEGLNKAFNNGGRKPEHKTVNSTIDTKDLTF